MMSDTIWVEPRNLKLINDRPLHTFPFFSFLESGAEYPKEFRKGEYYSFYLQRLAENTDPARINGIRTEKQIIDRLRYLKKLSETVKNDPFFKEIDRVQVFIDSVGHIRIFEGSHRAICALYHKIGLIPVEVIHRHPDWLKFKESLEAEYKSKVLYNPIRHPDFAEWGVMREDRAGIILHYLETHDFFVNSDKGGKSHPTYQYKMGTCHYFERDHAERLRGLDIGSHFGHFCHTLERVGAVMTGVEHNRKYYETAQYLNRVYELSSDFRHEDAYHFANNNAGVKFDFIIALSIFYCLFREEEKARGLLRQIDKITDLFFLDSAGEEGGLSDERLIAEITNNTGLIPRIIYSGKDGRNIYACSRS